MFTPTVHNIATLHDKLLIQEKDRRIEGLVKELSEALELAEGYKRQCESQQLIIISMRKRIV